MPEMPEVEIIRCNLEVHVKGKLIQDVKVLLPRQIKWPLPEAFAALLIGRTISAVRRKGKYLLFEMENGVLLVVHLRMTGRLCYKAKDNEPDPYMRIQFLFKDGDGLVYGDTRTLGTLYALREDELWRIAGLADMGPEPLSGAFTPLYLMEKLQKHRGKIKSFLLNQKYIGGLGNIYADECLILSSIHPERRGSSLSMEEIQKLHAAINRVIQEGIEDGGTTFRDYRNGNGEKGSHQERLYAYGRTGEPCRLCGEPIKKMEVGGRGTHFCSYCQK